VCAGGSISLPCVSTAQCTVFVLLGSLQKLYVVKRILLVELVLVYLPVLFFTLPFLECSQVLHGLLTYISIFYSFNLNVKNVKF